jgi:hypothetical protein
MSLLPNKVGQSLIFTGNDAVIFGPVYGERRVVPTHAPCRIRVIELRHLIKDFRIIRQGLKSVGEICRDVERRPRVACAQLHGQPSTVGGRFRPEIDDDVVNGAREAGDEFRLGERCNLIVHAAQGAFFPTIRNITLNDARIQPVLRKFLRAERARKKSSLVFSGLQLDDKCSLKPGLCKDHGSEQ